MKNHFILIKLPGHSSNGQKLSARLAAEKPEYLQFELFNV